MQNRGIYQSSWKTWPIRLWLLWGIVLWKESLCKILIVFILIKCIIMLYNQNKSCVNLCKKTLHSPKTHCFPQKPIVFQHVHFFIPLFWNEKLSLCTHVSGFTNKIPVQPWCTELWKSGYKFTIILSAFKQWKDRKKHGNKLPISRISGENICFYDSQLPEVKNQKVSTEIFWVTAHLRRLINSCSDNW